MTHQPAVGTAAVCFKFGWEDFKTARWLWRVDPWRARGRACWWLYIAYGLWKAAGVALLMNIGIILGLVLLEDKQRQGLAPAEDRLIRSFLGAWLMTLGGCVASFLMAAVAVAFARWNEVRLWLGSAACRSRRANLWPPSGPDSPRANRLAPLLATTGYAFAVLMTVPVALYSGVLRQARPGDLLLGIFLWSMFLLPACLAIWMYRAAGAQSARECWPLDELEAPSDDPVQ
jgi:hypothetical protein